jgi:hypothetical protein
MAVPSPGRQAWGLPLLGKAASAAPMLFAF